MKEIPLTRGLFAQVDDADYDWLAKWRWSARKGGHTHYAQGYNKAEGHKSVDSVLMHRLILGLTDPTIVGDHIDGNGLNNQRSNLRACTPTENKINNRRHRAGLYGGMSLVGAAKMKMFTLYMFPSMIRAIKKEAKAGGYESMSDFLRKLIRDYFENQKRNEAGNKS